MNMFTFTITLCSLLFWAFLAGVYFLKKNIKNIDTRFYKYILILDALQTILSLICIITAYYLDVHKSMMLIYDITARIFCVTQMMWYFLLMAYTVVIITENDLKFRNKILGGTRQGKIIRLVIITIMLIIIGVAPVNYDINEQGVLVYAGGRIDIMIYTLIIVAAALLVVLIKKRKQYQFKKIIPFLIIVVFQLIAAGISKIDSSINMYPLTITLISYLMYHTIENPDIKLISRLQVAKEEAEKSNLEKTNFLASMSHELRTPLNGIVGLSQLIVFNDDKEEIKEDGKDILKASNNLLELVDGMLDINNLESDKLELIEDNYSTQELLDELIKNTNIKLVDKEIEFRTNFSNMIPKYLRGDREKVKRIINNILTNGVKYTEKGFLDFNIDCENINNICNLTITIKDTGRGIREDQKDKLFTKFYRLSSDIDSDISGTGLGLAVTKSFLDLMHGSVDVDSIYGQGTTFTIRLNQVIPND